MTTNGKPAPYPSPDDDIPGWDDIPDSADWEHPEVADSHKSQRTESGKTEIQDARMTATAIRRGWIKPGDKRWPTDKTKVELLEIPEDERTLIERTIISVFQSLSGDERAAGIAAKTAVMMEGQNQSDEHKQMPSEHVHSHQLTVDDRRSKLAAIDSRLGAIGSGGVVVDEAGRNGKSDRPAIRRAGGNGAGKSNGSLPDDTDSSSG